MLALKHNGKIIAGFAVACVIVGVAYALRHPITAKLTVWRGD